MRSTSNIFRNPVKSRLTHFPVQPGDAAGTKKQPKAYYQLDNQPGDLYNVMGVKTTGYEKRIEVYTFIQYWKLFEP